MTSMSCGGSFLFIPANSFLKFILYVYSIAQTRLVQACPNCKYECNYVMQHTGNT